MRHLFTSFAFGFDSAEKSRSVCLAGSSILALSLATQALAGGPSGGTVASGTATISQTASTSTIRQSTQNAVIDWRSFDVDRDHHVVFDQPGAASATLNRVNSASRSVIDGTITAPGTVVIQNGAGVLFSKSARVDTGGLIATTQTVDADRFAATGNFTIEGGAKPGARVVNEGAITIGEAGLAALVGRDVENAGTIIAKRGTVALASGERTTIDLSGDGSFQIAVTGSSAGGGARQSGTIDAPGGHVLISAGDAASALDGVINTSGITRASGGSVRIIGRGQGKVQIGGRVSASAAQNGGAIAISGQTTKVAAGASVTANGTERGGSVELGGNYLGKGPLRRADYLDIEAGSVVEANATKGAAGRIIAWSEQVTSVEGRLSALGLSGGFVETSSKNDLNISSEADVLLGNDGAWLLDPRNVSIVRWADGITNAGGVVAPGDGNNRYEIGIQPLTAALNNGNDVTITTTGNGTSARPGGAPVADEGDIVVEAKFDWNGTGNLTLNADNNVVFDGSVTTVDGSVSANADNQILLNRRITSRGRGDINLTANQDIEIASKLRSFGTGDINVLSNNGDVTIASNSRESAKVFTQTSQLNINAPAGSIRMIYRDATSDGGMGIYSRRGDTNLIARDTIQVIGGDSPGQRSRIGTGSSSGVLTMSAEDIRIASGSASNTSVFVTVGRGGEMNINSDRFTLTDTLGNDGAVVRALKQADLNIDSTIQTWDGIVQAGTGLADGGNVRLNGNITASVSPIFDLAPDATWTLENGSSVDASVPFHVTTRGVGTIDVGGPMTAEQLTLITEERVSLRAGSPVVGTGPGDAVVIAAGRNFENEIGPDAVSTSDPDARWLVYINEFAGLSGDAPGPREYDLYGRLFADTPPDTITQTGNRVIYGEQPTVTLTAASLRKPYGTFAVPGYSAEGFREGDGIDTAFTSAPVVSSDGSPATANVGEYATTVTATLSDQGYLVNFVDGLLTIDPAILNITANDANRAYGAENPDFTVTYDGLVLGQTIDDLGGELQFTTDATIESDVGTYAITPLGLTSDNYTITYTDGDLSIDPAALTVTVDPAQKIVGSVNPPFTASFDGLVLDQSPADLGGTLTFDTDATPTSPVGVYDVIASGLNSTNYAITYETGSLNILPPQAVTSNVAETVEPFERGLPPLTPGDASFRTTEYDAPPDNPFNLTYSLGEIIQLSPEGVEAPTGTQGFVPAAGSLDGEGQQDTAQAAAADGCAGPINRGVVVDQGCARQTNTESYWTTTAEAAP